MSTTAHSYRPIPSSSLASLPVDLTPSTSPRPKTKTALPGKPTLAQRWESFIRVRQEYSLNMVRPSFFASAPAPVLPNGQRNAKPSVPSVSSTQGQRDMVMTTEARKLSKAKGKSKARRAA